jgi:alkanesulfonate monooxygenase SsuD/methylene tetrahydromethanopterin reductase-like flavin-dependent oxidoreductase (luciferase family)
VVGALERRGYDGCWAGEIDHDPFLSVLLAAEHTTRLNVGTSIAVAFARNPMTVANLGWDLQSYSGGRFNLGLGTQVKAHVEKRFNMPWSHPVRRMREFVDALHAIWSSWQSGSRLSVDAELAGALRARCAGVIDHVLPAFPAGLPEDAIDIVLDELRESSNSAVREARIAQTYEETRWTTSEAGRWPSPEPRGASATPPPRPCWPAARAW